MLSSRKIIKNIIIGIVVYILLVLLTNFYYLPTIKSAIADSDAKIDVINDDIITIDLPIRVLDNIKNQILSSSDNMNNQKLIDAYNGNILTLSNALASINSQILLLQEDLEHINGLTFDHLDRHHSNLSTSLEDVSELSITLLPLLVNQEMNTIDVEEIVAIQNVLNEKIEIVIQENTVFNTHLLSMFTWLVNILFLIMILMVLLLSFMVYKFILYDQKFVLDSFKQLSDKKFDSLNVDYYKPIFKEDLQIQNEIKEIFEDEKFTNDVKQLLLSTYHIDDMMDKLFHSLQKNNDIDRIGIAFIDYGHRKIIAESGVASYDGLKLGPGFEVDFDRTSLTTLLETKKSVISNNLEAELKMKPTSASLRLILDEGIQSNMIIPLLMGEVVFGLVFFSSKEKDYFNISHQKLAEKFIYEISGFLNRAYFTKVILSKITGSFAELVDKKDNETGGHINRMVAYSVLLARGLLSRKIPGYEINEKFVLEVERNASSHDIGKVGIPDEILKKPGKLTEEEWVIMKTHSTIGAEIFKNLRDGLQVFDSDFYKFAEEITRSHHERFDGSGYPQGLKGQDIPLAARIVAIADVFDALNSKRYYKDAFSFEKSIQIIKDSSGSHLDPVLVDIFLEHQRELEHIAQK